MRGHRSIILLATIALAPGCPANKQEVEAAKRSVYDAEFPVLYAAALDAVRETYPNIEEMPGRGLIKTVWHQVANANNSDDMTNPRTLANASGVNARGSTTQGQAGMPTRLAYKRYFIRFDVTIAGGRPWRIKVVGHAAEWEPGAAEPTDLHGALRPSWLDGRTDALIHAIYTRTKAYARTAPPEEPEVIAGEPKKADPAAFAGVPPAAAKVLAAIKDAVTTRDWTALRGHVADDVVWSAGGATGADIAMATWQADPEAFDALAKLVAPGGCAGDAKQVSCPGRAPAAGGYQLVLAPRGAAWQIARYAKIE